MLSGISIGKKRDKSASGKRAQLAQHWDKSAQQLQGQWEILGMESSETHEDQDMKLETSLDIVKVLRAVLRYFECNP